LNTNHRVEIRDAQVHSIFAWFNLLVESIQQTVYFTSPGATRSTSTWFDQRKQGVRLYEAGEFGGRKLTGSRMITNPALNQTAYLDG
jgi:hypothetical protein